MGFTVVVCKPQGGVVQLAPPASGSGWHPAQRRAFALSFGETHNVFGPNFRSKRCTKRESTLASLSLPLTTRKGGSRSGEFSVWRCSQTPNEPTTTAPSRRGSEFGQDVSKRGKRATDAAPCPESALL